MKKQVYLAKQSSHHTIIAGIDTTNKISYKFHKNFGFIKIETFKEVGFKFDKWLYLRFMQLMLKNRL